jgi:hypothetical protein
MARVACDVPDNELVMALARALLGAAVLLVLVAMGLLFVPPQARLAGRDLDCGASIYVMFPSDPYPRSDPRYEKSEACYAANVDRFRQAFVVGIAGGLCGLAAALLRRSSSDRQRPSGQSA